MNKENRRSKGFLGMAFIAVLGLALLAPDLGARDREGAQVIVTMKDWSNVQGELLAVQDNNLILMDSSAVGITASLADVRSIKVIKKGTVLKGIGLGLAVGAITGALAGASSYEGHVPGEGWIPLIWFSRGQLAFGGAVVFGVIGGALGGTIGAAAHRRTFAINGESAFKIKETVAKLRKLARERIS